MNRSSVFYLADLITLFDIQMTQKSSIRRYPRDTVKSTYREPLKEERNPLIDQAGSDECHHGNVITEGYRKPIRP